MNLIVERRTPDEEASMSLISSVVGEIGQWIRSEIPASRSEMLRETLEKVCKIFEAPRALLVWEEADEPWVNTAHLENESLAWKQSAPSTYEPLVSERLRNDSFFVTGDERPDTHNPIHPGLRKQFRIGSALAIPLEGETTPGWLFVLDVAVEPEHFLAGAIVASVVDARLGHSAYRESREHEEIDRRIRSITRDLHDGLLQSFTGVVLQLEALIPLIESDPEQARRRVTEVEGALMDEQRELRSYLESLSEKKRATEAAFDMNARLRDLAHRYHDQWGVEVEYRGHSLEPMVREALGWETYRIITEAITNATRHGHAKHVKVSLSTVNDRLIISVLDDGDGFPFRGRLDSDEMMALGVAPTSLTERVRSLNGEVSIESTDEGSLIEMSIPIGWRQA